MSIQIWWIKIDRYLIGTTHSSSFASHDEIGSETKASFGILDNPAHFPPSLKSLFRRVFGLHFKILIQITIHHPSPTTTTHLALLWTITLCYQLSNVKLTLSDPGHITITTRNSRLSRKLGTNFEWISWKERKEGAGGPSKKPWWNF